MRTPLDYFYKYQKYYYNLFAENIKEIKDQRRKEMITGFVIEVFKSDNIRFSKKLFKRRIK